MSDAFISREALEAATAICSVNGIPYDRIEFQVSKTPGGTDVKITVSYLLKGRVMVIMPVEEMHPVLEKYTLAITGVDGRISASIREGVKDVVRPLFDEATHGPTLSTGARIDVTSDEAPKNGLSYFMIDPAGKQNPQ